MKFLSTLAAVLALSAAIFAASPASADPTGDWRVADGDRHDPYPALRRGVLRLYREHVDAGRKGWTIIPTRASATGR